MALETCHALEIASFVRRPTSVSDPAEMGEEAPKCNYCVSRRSSDLHQNRDAPLRIGLVVSKTALNVANIDPTYLKFRKFEVPAWQCSCNDRSRPIPISQGSILLQMKQLGHGPQMRLIFDDCESLIDTVDRTLTRSRYGCCALIRCQAKYPEWLEISVITIILHIVTTHRPDFRYARSGQRRC